MSKQWPPSLTLDHQIKLDDLNCNLLIDQHGAAWIHCPGRGPDVPTLKDRLVVAAVLYLPLKYPQPVICNFRQRHPDVPVKDQMQKLQENYCGLGIPEHSATCNNCKNLQHAKKTPEIPNATVHLDVHGPFVSYGKNKFAVTLTDEATKITVFLAVKSKSADSLAYTIFTGRICRMAVPQVIATNLNEQLASGGPAHPIHRSQWRLLLQSKRGRPHLQGHLQGSTFFKIWAIPGLFSGYYCKAFYNLNYNRHIDNQMGMSAPC